MRADRMQGMCKLYRYCWPSEWPRRGVTRRERTLRCETLEDRWVLAAPTIGVFYDAPDPVMQPNSLTLITDNVEDSDGTIAQVEFYLDSDANGTLDLAVDTLLGNDTSSSGGWIWTGSSDSLPIGTNRYFARAQDDEGNWGNAATTTGTVFPRVDPDDFEPDNVAAEADPITTDGTPQAHNLHVGSDIDWVTFTLAETSNVTVETDGVAGDTRMWLFGPNDATQRIAFNDDGGAGLFSKIERTGSDALVPGTYYAKVDEYGNNDPIGSYTIAVTAEAVGNIRPTIDSLSDTPDPVTQPESLTLTAVGVTDGDGVVTQVEFYVDSNGNGTLEGGSDRLLGADTSAAGGWMWIESSATLPAGANRYFARAQDDAGQWSSAATTVGQVIESTNIAPTIATLTDSPDPLTQPASLLLTANGVSDTDGLITKVEFYLDSDRDSLFNPASDRLLGLDTNVAGGWSWVGSSGNLPVGTNRYFARAQDDHQAWSVPVSTTGTVVAPMNALPTIAALGATPNPVIQPGNLILAATGVNDLDGTVTRVEFYLDSDHNGVLNPATDRLLGSDSNAGDGWRWIESSSNLPIGTNRYFARAQDDLQAWSSAATVTGEVDPQPVFVSQIIDDGDPGQRFVGSWGLGGLAGAYSGDYRYNGLGSGADQSAWTFTDLPAGNYEVLATWTAHSNRASNAPFTISEGFGEVTVVVNQRIAPRNDATSGGSRFQQLGSIVVNATGTISVTLTDRADGFVIADAIWVRTVVGNSAPTIASLDAAPDPVAQPNAVALTAGGVADGDGSVAKVEFYLDSNRDGVLNTASDRLLGTDTSVIGGWTWNQPSDDLPTGTNRYFARAQDDGAAWSAPVATIGTVTPPTNVPPTIGGLNDSPDPVTQPANLTLTASLVADTDGSVANVEFYLDSDDNGVLDVATDRLLGTDTSASGGWNWVGSSSSLPVGANRYFARAQDNVGAVSAVVATTGTVAPIANTPPTIGAFSDSPDPVLQPANLTLTASSVADSDGSVAKVEFYLDGNGNGVLDVATDRLLGTDTSASGGWTWVGLSSSLPVGTNRYLARAQDDDGAWSPVSTTSGRVDAAAPTISRIIDDGTLGHHFVGTWGRGGISGAFQGDYWFNAAGNGADQSVWTFTDLPLGNYDVLTTWTAYQNRATNSPFALDGGSGETTVEVNQAVAPRNDAETQGSRFQRLATVNVNAAGILTVTLSDDANEYVIADAVWVRSSSGNAAPTIGGLTAAPDPVTQPDNLTLTAVSAADSDGSVAKVEFYLDSDNNGTLDPNNDLLLGTDTSATGGWTQVVSSASLPAALNRYLARAQDNEGAWSSVATITSTILPGGPSGDSQEPDNTPDLAKTIPTDGTPQPRSIHVGTDIDWVRFSVTERSDLTAETNGPTGDTRIWLFGPDNPNIQIDFDDDTGSGFFSKIVRNGALALEPGTYWLKVDEFGNNDPIDSYTIAVTTQPALAPAPTANSSISPADPDAGQGDWSLAADAVFAAGEL